MSILLRRKYALIISIIILAISCLAWSGTQGQNKRLSTNKTDTIPSKKIEEQKVKINEDEFDDDHDFFPESFLDIDWNEMDDQIESSVNDALDDCEIYIDDSMDDFDDQFDNGDLENNIEENMEFVQQAQKEFDINNSIEAIPKNLDIDIKVDLKDLKKEIERANNAVETNKKELQRELEKVQKEISQAGLTSI